MEECVRVHRTQMPLFPAKVNRGIIPERKKVLKSKNNVGLPLMVPDIVHKFKENLSY